MQAELLKAVTSNTITKVALSNYEAIADYFRRRATLERVIGGPLGRPE